MAVEVVASLVVACLSSIVVAAVAEVGCNFVAVVVATVPVVAVVESTVVGLAVALDNFEVPMVEPEKALVVGVVPKGYCCCC